MLARLGRLNTTVSSLAIAVNRVLTASYHACYENADPADELTLLTAPLASSAEVAALYQASLIDVQSALPVALHSLGSTASEIEAAMKRRLESDASGNDAKQLEAQTAAQLGEADSALKNAQTEAVRAGISKTKAEVGKINADTKKSLRDAQAPAATPASAGAGSAGAGSASGRSR